MIYRIIKGKIELIPEALSLVPLFSTLSEQQVRFIIIAYDYTGSPYRLKPEEYRIDMAEKITGIKRHSISDNIVEQFISCIYDMKRERKQLYQKKLLKLQIEFDNELTPAKLKDLSSLMDFVEKKITDIDQEIFREEEMEIILKGSKKMSFLEKMINSRKLYEIEKKNKKTIQEEL